MGDDVGDLRAKVLEQGLALEDLRRESADAEDHCKASRDELLERMTACSGKTHHERKAQ